MLESCFCDSVLLLDEGAWKQGCAPLPGAPFPSTRLPIHLGWDLGMDSNPSLMGGARRRRPPQFFLRFCFEIEQISSRWRLKQGGI